MEFEIKTRRRSLLIGYPLQVQSLAIWHFRLDLKDLSKKLSPTPDY